MTVTAPPSGAGRAGAGARASAVVAASLAALLGAALLLGAVGLLLGDALLRDGDGFHASPTERFTTQTYALTADPLDVRDEGAGWVLDTLATRVRIQAAAAGGPVFAGIARQHDIEGWLSGVAHERVTHVNFEPFGYDSAGRAGGAPRSLPTAERMWAASASGTGTQTLEWKVKRGRWGVVVMNADGRRGVTADVRAAVKARIVPIALNMVVVGLLALGGAALALRRSLAEGAR
jgi:hypothetical protein